MTRDLPCLDAPALGAACPRCSEPLVLVGYCGACLWDGAAEAQLAEARSRARTWQLAREIWKEQA